MKALLYARNGKENPVHTSIESQLENCQEAANKLGFKESMNYVDDGYSVNEERPSFRKMLANFEHGDAIIAYDAERLTRDAIALADYINKYNIHLVNGNKVSGFSSVDNLISAIKKQRR